MQIKNPKISIIVPAYNAANYISRCIESIICQTESDFEILIIDDGSSDSTGKICKDYQSHDRRVRYLYQNNCGVARARNLGLKNACGKYITFADADDWLEKDCFKICLEYLQNSHADILKFGYYINLDNGEVASVSLESPKLFPSNNRDILEFTDKTKYYAYVWNTFINHEIIRDILFEEDLNWLEDQIFGYRCFLKSRNTLFIPERLYHYTWWAYGSLSDVKNPQVIARAASLEFEIKKILTETSSYRETVECEYRWRLDYLVKSLYYSNYSISYRLSIYRNIKPISPLPTRESRLFFKKCVPFILKDIILTSLFKFKRFFKRETKLTRI